MQLCVIAHNIRSTYNVGAIFRTCEGFGVNKLYLTGYTPYPRTPDDVRLPFIADKLEKQIHKTALGTETMLPFEHHEDAETLIDKLKTSGHTIVGLEQTPRSIMLPDFSPPDPCILLLGEEVAGIPPSLQELCDSFIEIPMHGQKESFNVSVATGIALYALTNHYKA